MGVNVALVVLWRREGDRAMEAASDDDDEEEEKKAGRKKRTRGKRSSHALHTSRLFIKIKLIYINKVWWTILYYINICAYKS